MKIFKKEKTIRCKLKDHGYDIIVGIKNLHTVGQAVARVTKGAHVMIVTNEKVGACYLRVVSASLKRAGYKVMHHTVPDGERAKSEKELFRLLGVLAENRFDRQSTLVALGGGVVGDLTGFAASIFMRGITFVNIPTSLLAQVDSAIGGKTAINLTYGKNLVGTFYQPKLVFVDVATIETLPQKEIINGSAEVIKYGMVFDEVFFSFLEDHVKALCDLDLPIIEKIVTKCIHYKVKVVEQDEREAGLRAVLNYGHTFGHALEAIGRYRTISHGIGVGLGMYAAARCAHQLGMFDQDSLDDLAQLIAAAGLPCSVKPFCKDTKKLIAYMQSDKKVVDQKIRLVLPTEIGTVVIRDDIPNIQLRKAYEF